MNQKYITSFYTSLKKKRELTEGITFLLVSCFSFLVGVCVFCSYLWFVR